MAIYALLVGVNEYLSPTVNPLQGCENDVDLFAKTLRQRFEVEEYNIISLKSGEKGKEATRQNIITQFQEHLIGKAKQDDVAIFYFSGHGAQSRTHDLLHDMEPDGLDESMVCHDSRTQDIPDLRDKDLRFLLKQLEKNCGHIAVFLDCCHGGHGTRFLDEDMSCVRLGVADMRPYPLEKYLFAGELPASPTVEDVKALLSPPPKHMLLAGCRDHQLSREREQEQGEGKKPKYNGLFTYALCETLNTISYPISYRELGTRIYMQVQKQQLSQSPQIEAIGGADDNAELLGGKVLPLNLLVFNRDKKWWVNAGAIHGFNKGDKIALFAGEVNDDFSAAPVVEIQQLNAFDSTLAILDGASLDDTIQYNGVVIRRHFDQTAIRFAGDADKLAEVQQKLDVNASPPTDLSRFLKLDDATARYTLHAENGEYFVTQPDDPRPLFTKVATVNDALKQLAVMARWWQKLGLANPETRLPTDAVDIVIRYDDDTYISQDVTLRYKLQDDRTWKQPEFTLELSLNKNYPGGKNYPPALYCALLYFDSSTGDITGGPLITTTLLTHQQSAMPGGMNAVSVVPVYEGDPIPLKIDDSLHQQGVTKVQDFIKIIVSEKEFDSSLLEQAGNELFSAKSTARSIMNTLEQFMDASHRGLDLKSKATRATDWYAKSITLTVIRPQDVQDVQSDRAVLLASDGKTDIRVEPHPSFKGTVRLINAYDENSHYLETTQGKSVDKTTAVEEPAIFANKGAMIDFSKGRNADMGLDAVEIFIDSGARGETDAASQVTVDNPLQFSIKGTLAEGEYIIPYIFDDKEKRFLSVGYAANGVGDDKRTYIRIDHLPEEASRYATDTKSLGSALKIYFRKLIYRDLLRIDEKVQFLYMPEFDQEESTKVRDYLKDTAKIAEQVAAANRILLIMHGIIGQTSSMAGCVNLKHTDGQPTLRDQYDLVLTFDYENLNTPIQETAIALREKLAEVGITAESGKHLDIVAHSMGGLVSRWFIEREGGDGVVNRLVMVGTPNGGSPMFKLKQTGESMLKAWAGSSLTAALNGMLLSPIVSGAVVAALTKLLDATGKTLAQMDPGSGFLKDLVTSSAPQQTRYAVIAGYTTGTMIPPDHYTENLGKLMDYLGKRIRIAAYDVASAKLFGNEANDIAVGLSSMVHFNKDWGGSVPMEAVCCDHLSYFQDKVTVQKIAQQLQ